MSDDLVARLLAASIAGDMPLGRAFDCLAVAEELVALRQQLRDACMRSEHDACEIERLTTEVNELRLQVVTLSISKDASLGNT